MPKKALATKAATVAMPLEQIRALLPAVTNDELLALIVDAFDEGNTRAWNYAELLDLEGTSRDVLNEGAVFATKLDDLRPLCARNKRMVRIGFDIDEARKALFRDV